MTKTIQQQPRGGLLGHLQQDINRLFEPFGWTTENELWDTFSSEWSPRVDIKDKGPHYLICADVPGVDPKEIDVSMENNILTIKGDKETKVDEKDENYLRVERTKGSFMRRFSLPESVDSERIKAKSKHGVLEITIPKATRSTSKKIEIHE
ncbi:Hsp20/alpha crystallin family protein [Coxiella endosymbiont of Amblyomma nuttalli]|uniref:Hsp20/alpha crystallin family protein n=1 Tax=Coxiella endosymbiont of Amblyomma nuttalli TaxID=2749996 RepID=UPI001BA8FD7D|nr:Hsp20/alpha crystallin family protein [Coxiella endosymbiont of Amblyomma nuttalli]QTS83958.1 Spore protein SP21 [Coxiella endosymbiont of Amblyomma nuttalli]